MNLLTVKTLNLFLGFFHGEQALVALVLGGLIVVVLVPLVFYFWLWHSKASPRKLTYTFVIFTGVVCVLMVLTRNDPISLSHLTLTTIFFIFSLPWNVITLLTVSIAGDTDIGDAEMVSAMLLGAAVNSVLVYYAAKRFRGWKE